MHIFTNCIKTVYFLYLKILDLFLIVRKLYIFYILKLSLFLTVQKLYIFKFIKKIAQPFLSKKLQ